MRQSRRGFSCFAISLLFIYINPNSAFHISPPRQLCASSHIITGSPRRHDAALTELHASRRETLLAGMSAVGLWFQGAAVASAATDTPMSSPFDSIRFELYDPSGGVALMQERIDLRDFEGLLEFTKGYDQVLRKQYMGKAKKLLPKELQDKATLASNAVTFDLIGINRSSRKGQENYEDAVKYLGELKQDAESFLALEGAVEVLQ